ncbi:hypothetical protein [Lysinibacillus xylanilyticus]|nr:hypothetical protein [Lysinibacillus xylanilyticus]
MCKYISMKDELDSLTVASKAKYGIESTMPKAVGSTSDPVHADVQIGASSEDHIKEELLIGSKFNCMVTGDIEQEVTICLLEGAIPLDWGLNMSYTTVQRVRERVIDMMNLKFTSYLM